MRDQSRVLAPLADLKIVVRSLAALKPNERNARTHSRRQIRQIADSIAAFGFNNPVLVDDNNTIIAGHGRVEAAKLLGLSEVPTCVLCERPALRHLKGEAIRACRRPFRFRRRGSANQTASPFLAFGDSWQLGS